MAAGRHGSDGSCRTRLSGATYDLSDRLGTAAKQTNASAATTASRTYDAFGLLVASTGTPQGPFGFVGAQGYQEDADTGLKLLGHRYYEPAPGASSRGILSRTEGTGTRTWTAIPCGAWIRRGSWSSCSFT